MHNYGTSLKDIHRDGDDPECHFQLGARDSRQGEDEGRFAESWGNHDEHASNQTAHAHLVRVCRIDLQARLSEAIMNVDAQLNEGHQERNLNLMLVVKPSVKVIVVNEPKKQSEGSHPTRGLDFS